MKLLLLSALSMIAFASAAQRENSFPVQARTETGTVEGLFDTKTGLQLYLGVPFAQPPVGDLRWKAPQPVTPWKGVLSTKKFGPRPVQGMVFGDMVFRSDGISEDCLYLNIWTPAGRKTKALPVLVYFYGGGFVAGDGSEPRYDGASMAEKGIVVVTVNYRLNIFGFFAHPELSKESPYHGSGNYGLLDQHAALEWVKKNIASFGGDPSKVTIAGESAGSISVSAQMGSPLSKGLIAGAIGESGAAIRPTLFPVPLAEAEKTGAEFAKSAGYSTLAQLRALTTLELYEIYTESKRFGFPTVIDGYFYPKSLTDIFNSREQAQVPLLLGWNSAEANGMAFMQGLPYSEENFVKKVRESFTNDSDEVLKLYAHGTNKDIEKSAAALASDRFISYSTWKWFDLQRKNSGKPVYRYLFARVRPPLVNHTGPLEQEPVGAAHATEIEYCMGNLELCKQYAWTEDDRTVSQTMESYFANFIINGDPNGDKLPTWPSAKATDQNPPVMIIDVQSRSVPATDDGRYEFLDRFYKNK